MRYKSIHALKRSSYSLLIRPTGTQLTRLESSKRAKRFFRFISEIRVLITMSKEFTFT
ncbi:MAG TPA: DUF1852 domain-containing protein, partial [Acinetobacter nosocomialis]|nr:DUF1852 domain-containing protein [Acinetobacter nosocomialis]